MSAAKKNPSKRRRPGPSMKIMRVQIDFAVVANRAFNMPGYDTHSVILNSALFIAQRILKRSVCMLSGGYVKTTMCEKPPRGFKFPEKFKK